MIDDAVAETERIQPQKRWPGGAGFWRWRRKMCYVWRIIATARNLAPASGLFFAEVRQSRNPLGGNRAMHIRRRSAVLCLAIALGAFLAPPALAQQVDFLGSRTVADLSETDVIQAAGAARYRSVRLCVARRAVHFRDLDIVFANGGSQNATIRTLIGAGGCTRWIDLRGARRNIARIVMRYDTLINIGRQAVVSAYGRR